MKLYRYAVLFLLAFYITPGAGAQAIYKPYNPYWQWGRSDSARSFPTPGNTVLAVHNNKAFWGRMTSYKRYVSDNESQGDWILGEYDSLGRAALTTTTIRGKVHLIDAQSDAAGNWYVLGRWYDSAIFSVNSPYIRTNPATNSDANHFLVRFDAGTLFPSWITIVGPFSNVSARTFVVDNNRILIAADSGDATMIRSINTANGASTTLFRQSGTSTSTSIQVDASGAIYLAGSCATGGIDFNGASEPATADPYSYIVKYRPDGTHIWHHWLHDSYCYPRKLTLFNNRVLYYSGNLTDTFVLGGLPLQPTTVSSDYIVARMDTSGNPAWLRQLPVGNGGGIVIPGEPYHAVVTPDTSLVLFARGAGFIDWQDTLASNFQAVNASALVSIGYDSRTRWVRDVYTDVVMNQHIATEGTAIWISGYAYSTAAAIAMDTMRTLTSLRKYSPFIAKTRMLRPIPANPGVGIEPEVAEELRTYPVPARTTLIVEGFGPSSQISLIDMNGRRIRREEAGGRQRIVLDVADLPRGFYLLELRDADGSRTIRRVSLQ